jgi:rod shape-determining protein MreD
VTFRIAFVAMVCLLLCVLESVIPFLFHLRAARPDLLLIVIVYLALHDDVVQGAGLAAVAGYLSDLTSATPSFLYTFLAVLTFVVVRLLGSALRTEGGIQSVAVGFVASVAHSLLAAAIFGFLTGAGHHIARSQLLWSAVGTALATPFVFRLFRTIDSWFARPDEAPMGIR